MGFARDALAIIRQQAKDGRSPVLADSAWAREFSDAIKAPRISLRLIQRATFMFLTEQEQAAWKRHVKKGRYHDG